MKTNKLFNVLLIFALLQTVLIFKVAAQKVDTLDYENGTKISTTAIWNVGKDYHAETWFGNIEGTASLATYRNKSFQIDWDLTVYGFLHEVGLYNLNVPVDSVNPKAKSKYKHKYSNITGSGGHTGLYGWFGDAGTPESIELYINENWVGDESIDMSSCIKKGTITVDGATYDIYTRPRKGDKFAQWWSNRTSPRTKGTISYAKHFQEWRKLGLPEINLTRLTYAFECTWGSPTGGSLKYSYFQIDKPLLLK
ncbi:MAG: glycoside hydrolase family 11 protein [Salinivirgaceae bacterium]|jgi:hypothetical protein|nr:glycoside hydrolase family 11 protein [Salinivirgaceae bacterium]